jgi:hypothetical protein
MTRGIGDRWRRRHESSKLAQAYRRDPGHPKPDIPLSCQRPWDLNPP